MRTSVPGGEVVETVVNPSVELYHIVVD